jgi:hypothetical protein
LYTHHSHPWRHQFCPTATSVPRSGSHDPYTAIEWPDTGSCRLRSFAPHRFHHHRRTSASVSPAPTRVRLQRILFSSPGTSSPPSDARSSSRCPETFHSADWPEPVVASPWRRGPERPWHRSAKPRGPTSSLVNRTADSCERKGRCSCRK